MNKKTITQVIETLKGVKLPEGVRSRMRAELSSYADFHTVPAYTAGVPAALGKIRSFLAHFPLATTTVLLLVAGSSVAYAAHGSLPGSPLYAVKVGILEPVEKVLTVPEQTPVEWSVTLAQRRLDEADAIASSTKPSARAEVQAAREVAAAARDVEKNIGALASSSREEASTAFTQALAEHESTLIRLTAVASTSDAIATEEMLNNLVTETHAQKEHDSPNVPSQPSPDRPQSGQAAPGKVPADNSENNVQD